jgi:hypothetical protein
MKKEEIITKVAAELDTTFSDVNTWLIAQILEHIYLTSRFLLILINKASKKALKNLHNHNLEKELENYVLGTKELAEIGTHLSFKWVRPEHMEPTGEMALEDVRQRIRGQLNECLEQLQLLKNGEGVLYKTTMTVNDIGKLDVYQYIYFLALHAKRHVAQMEKVEMEFNAQVNRNS